MGNLFSGGGGRGISNLSESQRNLLPGLGEFFGGQIGVEIPGIEELRAEVLGSLDGGEALAREIFEQGFLDPALRTFDRRIAPRINTAFAGIGGSLSSRRGVAQTEALTDIITSAQGDFTRMLPEILGFPARNAGASAQALSLIEQLRFLPTNQVMNFLGLNTQTVVNQSPGVGFNILGDVLGAGATVGAAGLLGGAPSGFNPGIGGLPPAGAFGGSGGLPGPLLPEFLPGG